MLGPTLLLWNSEEVTIVGSMKVVLLAGLMCFV